MREFVSNNLLRQQNKENNEYKLNIQTLRSVSQNYSTPLRRIIALNLVVLRAFNILGGGNTGTFLERSEKG